MINEILYNLDNKNKFKNYNIGNIKSIYTYDVLIKYI